ncbi:MAG: hypothetical protein IAE63_00070 [Alphaproteobacteria bacterium]|nr:hypothetical protein [Alphaproteobacteria bacterium]
MKTYSPYAGVKINDLAGLYEDEVLACLEPNANAHFNTVKAVRQISGNNQSGELPVYRRMHELKLAFEIAALQTIQSAEHLDEILFRRDGDIARQGWVDIGVGLDIWNVFNAPRLEGWSGRLRDIPVSSEYSSPIFKNGNVTYLKINPQHVEGEVFRADVAPRYDSLSPCILVVEQYNNATLISIEKDEFQQEGAFHYAPNMHFMEFYHNARAYLDNVTAEYGQPQRWFLHDIGDEHPQTPEFFTECSDRVNRDGVRVVFEDVRKPYRPRAVDLASVVKFDKSGKAVGFLSLDDLQSKWSGTAKLGLHTSYSSDVTPSGFPYQSKSVRKDMVTLLWDAARDELLNEDGSPQSGKELALAQRLRILPLDYK